MNKKISALLIGNDNKDNSFNSLLLGNRKSKYSDNPFLTSIMGSHRLKDSDKDFVPDIFDCSPFNSKRDAPIIPAELQPPTAPLTQEQIKQEKIATPIIQEIQKPTETKTSEQLRQENAQDTLNEIDNRIRKYQEQYNKYDELYNKTSNSTQADSYDRKRIEAQYNIDALNEARQYATGEYIKSDVMGYAQNKAEALTTRNMQLVQESRLRKIQEPELIAQAKQYGYEPVYKQRGTERYIEYFQTKQEPIKQTITPIVQEKKQMPLEEFKQRFSPAEQQALQLFQQKKEPTYNLGGTNLPYQTRGTKTGMMPDVPSLYIAPKEKTILDVQPVKGSESKLIKVESSKQYQTFMKYSEPIRLTAFGISSLVSKPLSYVYEPFLGLGRGEGEDIGSKAYRGGLMAVKVGALESNPVTAIPSNIYFGSSLISKYSINPASAVIGESSIGAFIFKEPFEFVGGIVGGASKGITGGVVKGIEGYKEGVSTSAKVSEAVDVSVKYAKETGVVTEKSLGVMKLNQNQKVELKRLLDEGYSIKKYETGIKAKEGYEEFTPKVKGEFIEVTNKQGNLIKRESIGKIEAEFRGKKVESDSIGGAISQIQKEGGVKGYSEILDIQRRKPVIGVEGGIRFPEDKITLSKFIEESKQVGYKKVKEPLRDEVTLFHGTSESSAKQILEKGLTPKGELREVYLTGDVGYAKGFAGRTIAKTGFKEKPAVLEINIPKSEYENLLVRREVGIGGTPEITLKEVPSKYISEYTGKQKPKVTKELSKTETEISLLGTEKYKGQPLLKGYGKQGDLFILPNFENLKKGIKPISRTESIVKKTPVSARIDILTGREANLVKFDIRSETFGIGKTTKITEKTKISKPMKSFKTIEEKPFQIKYEQPKITTDKGQVLELSEPSYVRGGEVGMTKQGKYYGQQYQVPIGTEATNVFTGKLGKEYGKGYIESGIKKGLSEGFNFGIAKEEGINFERGLLLRTETKTKETKISPTKITLGVSSLLIEKPSVKETPISNIVATRNIAVQNYGLGSMPKFNEAQLTSQAQRQELKFETPQIQKPSTTTKAPFTFSFPFETPTPMIETPFERKKKKVEKKKSYITEVRRKGKFIQVSKPTEFKSAFGIGIEKVKSTLGASFRLRESETGNVVPLGFSSQEFRPSKRESGVIIQQRGFRLGSLFERKEIQRAKSTARRNPLGF